MYFLSLNRHMTLFILFFKMCIQFKQKVCSIKNIYFYPAVGTNYTFIQRWAQTILLSSGGHKLYFLPLGYASFSHRGELELLIYLFSCQRLVMKHTDLYAICVIAQNLNLTSSLVFV